MKYGYMAAPQPGQNRAAALLSRDGLREYILKFQVTLAANNLVNF